MTHTLIKFNTTVDFVLFDSTVKNIKGKERKEKNGMKNKPTE